MTFFDHLQEFFKTKPMLTASEIRCLFSNQSISLTIAQIKKKLWRLTEESHKVRKVEHDNEIYYRLGNIDPKFQKSKFKENWSAQ
jgi:hypothetical protein